MAVPHTESNPQPYTRRGFLKRAGLGVVALGGLAAAAGRLMGNQRRDDSLPGPGSIFEPRREDLRRYWKEKLDRWRLR